MVCNLNHNITSTYSQVIVVDGNSQAADLAIANMAVVKRYCSHSRLWLGINGAGEKS